MKYALVQLEETKFAIMPAIMAKIAVSAVAGEFTPEVLCENEDPQFLNHLTKQYAAGVITKTQLKQLAEGSPIEDVPEEDTTEVNEFEKDIESLLEFIEKGLGAISRNAGTIQKKISAFKEKHYEE